MIIDNYTAFSAIEGLLKEGHAVTLRTKGYSMLPFIVGGRDKVVLQQAVSWQEGDIVLAHLPEGRYVLHRIYRLSEEKVILMGDGNLQATECCKQSDIVGMAVQIIRDGRVVDCRAAGERWRARLWRWLLPLRRYIVWIYRRYANKRMY